MRLVAILVILCATGQIANWHPFGAGALIRSGVSLLGISGGVLLLCQRRCAWLLLMPWALLQSLVWITDSSGPWFYQSLMLGNSTVQTVSMNNQIIRESGKGFNLVGPIWFAIFLFMRFFKRFPRLHSLPKPAWLTYRIQLAVLTGLMIFFGGWHIKLRSDIANALIIIETDIPLTRVYYRDQLLGRTPLIITPKQIAKWGLPLDASTPLAMESSSWTHRPILYNKDHYQSRIHLDLQVPSYAPTPRTLPTPWGTRHVALGGNHDTKVQKFILWYPDETVSPFLQMKLLSSGPYHPGQHIQIECTLSNPVKTYVGQSPTIEVRIFPFEKSQTKASPTVQERFRQPFLMDDSWATLRTNARLSSTITVQLPDSPGYYTLMSTFTLLESQTHNRLMFGSPHSNYHLIQITEPQQTIEETASSH